MKVKQKRVVGYNSATKSAMIERNVGRAVIKSIIDGEICVYKIYVVKHYGYYKIDNK